MSTPGPGLVVAIKALPRPVWILFGGTFINRFGSFVGVFIVLYLTRKGYSVPQAGLALAAFGLGSLPGSALGGYFADRVGRRETIVLATFVNAAATVGLALVQGLPLILALMAIVGTSFQAQRAPVAAMITDLVPPGNRVAAMGVMRFFVNAGFAAGPAAAGLLADRSFLLLFAGDALTSVIFGVIALVGLPGGAPRSTGPERRGEATRDPGGSRLPRLHAGLPDGVGRLPAGQCDLSPVGQSQRLLQCRVRRSDLGQWRRHHPG